MRSTADEVLEDYSRLASLEHDSARLAELEPWIVEMFAEMAHMQDGMREGGGLPKPVERANLSSPIANLVAVDRSTQSSGLLDLSLTQARELVSRREVSPVELTRLSLERATHLAPQLNCYISLLSDRALALAHMREDEVCRGVVRPLHGIPLSIKDNIDVAGAPTTAGSALLRNRPARHAAVVSRLEQAGAVIVAKANMYEFGFGGPSSKFGGTRNPWSLSRTAGGSSGGSAASVAARLCFGSIGTDTGGSIRIPSAFCGVVGTKPTLGSVSRRGVVPGSRTLDHVGPIARTAADSLALLRVIAGSAERRSSLLADIRALQQDQGLRGIRIGLAIPEHDEIGADAKMATSRAAAVLGDLGATVEEVALPDLSLARTVMWVISGVEAAEMHRAQLRRRANDYSPLVRLRLERAEYIPATYYVRAQRIRQHLAGQLSAILRGLDALAVPGCAEPAYALEAADGRVDASDAAALRRASLVTALFAVTGHPAMTVPCGFVNGLPIAMQIVAAREQEDMCFRIAHAYQQSMPWHLRSPAMQDATPAVNSRGPSIRIV